MRLIDADALGIGRCSRKVLPAAYCAGWNGVINLIDIAPTVDAVAVVRCKDCKYGNYDSKPDGAMVCLRTKDGFWRKETDFCSYGARMRQAKRGKVRRKYGEILALYRYCVEAGMTARLERLHDGWAVRFPNGGDFAQHAGTYGAHDGFVEPAIGCESDYSPVSLREAEKLICENRERLMTPSCEGERGMEGE